MTHRIILLALALTTCDGQAVMVVPSTTSTDTSSPLGIRIENHLTESIFLPGCNAYLMERKDGGAWKVVYQKNCFWEGNGVEIAAGEKLDLEQPLDMAKPGTHRIRVDYKLGCRPAAPLSQADCRDGATAASVVVEIASPPQ